MPTIEELNQLATLDIVSIKQNGSEYEAVFSDGSVGVFYGLKFYGAYQWKCMLEARAAQALSVKNQATSTIIVATAQSEAKAAELAEYNAAFPDIVAPVEEPIE